MNQVLRSRRSVGLYFAMVVAAVYLTSVFVVPISASAYSASPLAATAPKIILRPFNSEPGKSVKVTGLRFTAGSTVTITFNGITVDSKVPVNSTGGFVTSFIVPKGTAVGSYPVVATDAKGLQATNTLMIGTAAKIVLTTGGKPRIVGTMLTVTGTGFLPSVTVTVYFSGVAEATPTSSTTGGFVTTFAVPAVPQGSQEVSASDGTNNAQRAFIVNPHITASPTTAAPGATITVTGTGFAAGSSVSFTLNGAALTATATTDGTGSFSVPVQIPTTAVKGGQPLVATDASLNKASVRIKVS